MIEQARARLAELERDYAAGERQLGDLMRQETALRETMLRIAGAMQVLRELTSGDEAAAGNGTPADGAVLTVP